MPKETYNAENITVLEGLEAVRVRPVCISAVCRQKD